MILKFNPSRLQRGHTEWGGIRTEQFEIKFKNIKQIVSKIVLKIKNFMK